MTNLSVTLAKGLSVTNKNRLETEAFLFHHSKHNRPIVQGIIDKFNTLTATVIFRKLSKKDNFYFHISK